MKNRIAMAFLAAALGIAPHPSVWADDAPAALPQSVAAALDEQDVIWDSPSVNSTGSMPLGNGDIGLNVLLNPAGDLVLLISKSDAFDEFNRLLKIGRIHIRTTPALFTPGQPFSQALHLADGVVNIKSGGVAVRLWVDANHPVAQVDLVSDTPVAVNVVTNNWRKENRALGDEGPGVSSAYGNWPDKNRVNADTVLAKMEADSFGQIGWCHHNVESQWRRNLEHTGLGAEIERGIDPIFNRSFGALVRARGVQAVSNGELRTVAPTTEFSAQILAFTDFADSPSAWQAKAQARWTSVEAAGVQRFAAHQKWWRAFWNRSWIFPKGDAKADIVARAYTLQRFVTACAGRGALPIKFNGSLFSVAGRDPDFRAWGGAYWWQNTREAYWAMPYAGDYDMMIPLFAMYKNALPLREAATKKYYGHEGAFFPETMFFWGNYTDVNYGLDRQNKPDGLTDNTFIRYYWQGGLELVAMMLDAHDGTQDPALRDQVLLPIAKAVTTFYDQHWPRKDGKILFEPAQSLETWHVARNPLPEIAALRFILPRLLQLPADAVTKAMWTRTLADLPPMPTVTQNGKTRLLPAETFSVKSNIENPELYAVFPYRICTAMAGGEELEQGLNTWRARRHTEDKGWQQNCIQAALLGLADEARAMVVSRAQNTAGYRFPGFFGPNYDWTPEQCHGTNMQTALQRMVMQCEGGRIKLLPAWPQDWQGSFKLHAPQNTTVEGRIEAGKVLDLQVIPETRRKDVVVSKE